MQLYVLPAGPLLTNGYLLAAPELGAALLIDAPADVRSLVAPLLADQKCRLTNLWLTHGHFDHLQGAAELVRQTNVTVSGHRDDQVLFEHPEMMEQFMGERLDLEPVHVDDWFSPGERRPMLGTEVEVRHVPGHCPGNVLFYFASQHIAFVGDALFNGGYGRTDLPGGSFPVLEHSIRTQIYSLPDETVIFPGHGPQTTVGHEKATNPFIPGR